MKRKDMQPGVLHAIQTASYGVVRPGWIVDKSMGWKRGERTQHKDANDWLPFPVKAEGGTYVVVEVLDSIGVYDRDEDGEKLRKLLEKDQWYTTAVPTNWVLGTWHDYTNDRYASIRQRQLDQEQRYRDEEERKAALFARAIRFAPIIEAAIPNPHHPGTEAPAFARNYVETRHHGFFNNEEIVRLFEWLVERDPTLLTELPALDCVTLDGEMAQVGKAHWPTCRVRTLDGRREAEFTWPVAQQIINNGGDFRTRNDTETAA